MIANSKQHVLQGKTIKLLIAEDHEIVRYGIKKVLTLDSEIQIIDEASNGLEAYELSKYYNPDLILLDISMPEMNGVESAKLIKAFNNQIRILIFTSFEDINLLEDAICAGVDGFISKQISSKHLIEAIKLCYDGKVVFSRSILDIYKRKLTDYYLDTDIPYVLNGDLLEEFNSLKHKSGNNNDFGTVGAKSEFKKYCETVLQKYGVTA